MICLDVGPPGSLGNLRPIDKYISPVADTFAWVLMKNHFHFLVRIKSESEINLAELNLQGFAYLEGLERINKQFSNLFNASSTPRLCRDRSNLLNYFSSVCVEWSSKNQLRGTIGRISRKRLKIKNKPP